MKRQPDSINPFILQALVFALVAATFAVIYITQPILPLLRVEFGVDATQASLTVSAVILGIALSNLPFGRLADRHPVKPLIAIGALCVAGAGIMCSLVHQIAFLIAFRFMQGVFIPAIITSLVAYLARSLPLERLNVVMGSYIAATLIGATGGRVVSGWLFPPSDWRWVFVYLSAFVCAGACAALAWLPRERIQRAPDARDDGYLALLRRPDLLRIYVVAFSELFIFSALFNYLPFYLSGPDFGVSTKIITLMYLSFLVGVVVAPVSGKLSNRLGNGVTMITGAGIFALSLAFTHVHSLVIICVSLIGVCAGFFAIHAAAVGALNRRLSASRGRANSLYVLFYYLGGSVGITVSGYSYQMFGWKGVTGLGMVMLIIIALVGIVELKARKAG